MHGFGGHIMKAANLLADCRARPEFPRFYKGMIALRQASSALRRGLLEWLRNSDASRVVTYLRLSPDEEMLMAINFSNRPFSGWVEVTNGQAFSDVTLVAPTSLPPDAPAPARAARLLR